MNDLITIKEVCSIAKMSQSTVYRKVKRDEFPAPVKVPTTAARGPRLVNRWERRAVKNHCITRLKQCAINTARALDGDLGGAEAEVYKAKNATNVSSAAHEPWFVKHKFVLQAVVGGFLAATALAYFGLK